MKNIYNFSLSKVRVLELTSFISDELTEAAKIESGDLAKIASQLTEYNNQFSSGIYIRRANPLTAKIKENSAMLSRIFSAMRAVVKVELLNPFAEHAEEAKVVRPFLKSYASVFSKGSLRQKMEHAEKFVQEAGSEKFKEKMKALKLDVLLSSFAKLQTSLAVDFAERGDEITSDKKVDMKALRKLISHRYAMLIHFVDFLQHFSPSQEVTDFIVRHNNRVAELKSVIHLRSTSSAKRVRAKRVRLRELALNLGWQLPIGAKDFQYERGVRILHPTENIWYRLGHKDNQITLVKAKVLDPCCHRKSGKEKEINLSDVKNSAVTLGPTEASEVAKPKDKSPGSSSKESAASSATDSSSSTASKREKEDKNSSEPTPSGASGNGKHSSADVGGF